MDIKTLTALVCINMVLVSFNHANAALMSKLGGSVVYDTDLDITWLANANTAKPGFDGDGFMTWESSSPSITNTATDWIDALNLTSYLGFSNWRLPTTLVPDSSCIGDTANSKGTSCSGSEMGHLFHIEGITAATPGLFTNVQSGFYWSGTSLDAANAYHFSFADGDQDISDKTGSKSYAWAVHDGDFHMVP